MYMDLVDRLHEKLMEQPLCPKILLAKSYAEGHLLLEQICKRKGFIYNVEVQTLLGLVMDNAKLELYRKQVTSEIRIHIFDISKEQGTFTSRMDTNMKLEVDIYRKKGVFELLCSKFYELNILSMQLTQLTLSK